MMTSPFEGRRSTNLLPGRDMKPGEQMVVPLPQDKFPGVTIVVTRTTRDYAYDWADALNEIRTSAGHKWVVSGKGEVRLVMEDGREGVGGIWRPAEEEIAATHEVCGRYARSGISVKQFQSLSRRGQIAREVDELVRARAMEHQH